MLVIRQEQIQAMLVPNDEQLELLVAEAVRAAGAERVRSCDDEIFGSMIKTAVARAKSHELTKPEDIAAFAAVMFEIAPNFDEHQDIKSILSDSSFPPADRFYQLFERVSENSWTEAEKRYDELVWFPTRPSA